MAISKETLEKMLKEMSDDLKKQMPNGELTEIKSQMDNICGQQETMSTSLTEIEKRLLNPENGIVVSVNELKKDMYHPNGTSKMDKMHEEVQSLGKWRKGVNRGLWGFFASIIAFISKGLYDFFN